MTCPFCAPTDRPVKASAALAFAIDDAFPVSPGHCLVVPVRHVASFFDLTDEERRQMFEVLELARRRIDAERQPAGVIGSSSTRGSPAV